MFNQIIKGIKTVFQDKDSLWISIVSAIGISYIFYWLLYKVTTIQEFIKMTQNGEFGPYSYLYAIVYWVTTVITVILFGIASAAVVWLWKRSLLSKNIGGSNVAGAFMGALGSACPVCGAFLFSSLGMAGAATLLPFQGLELKIASLGLVMGSTVFATKKVAESSDCEECEDISKHSLSQNQNTKAPSPGKKRLIILNWAKVIVPVLTAVFIINQFLISQTAASMGLQTGGIAQLVGIKTVAAKTIIAPKLNADSKTTSLVEQPTITEVTANPNTGDALADAKVVMTATGKPFYAPDDISFDDPINAQQKWGAYENSIQLNKEHEARYQKLVSTMICSYCCGGATSVTLIKQCGCAHARAVRGFYKYMLQTYGDQYSDEELVGESHRWYAIWYPKGMLEDYLLATGKSDALPHNTHGGAGRDGRHGL